MQAAPRAPKLQLKSPIELAVRGMLRHPIYLAVALLVSASVAGALSFQFRNIRHHYAGKMLYIPNRVTEPYYVSPDLRNLTDSIISPAMRDSIKESCGLDDDLMVFSQQLRFDVTGSSTIDAAYSNADPNKSREVLQFAMEELIARSKEIRRDAMQQHIADVDREIETERKRADAAHSRLRIAMKDSGIASASALDAAIIDQRKNISEAQTRIIAAKDQGLLSRAQFDALLALRDQGSFDSSNPDANQSAASGNGARKTDGDPKNPNDPNDPKDQSMSATAESDRSGAMGSGDGSENDRSPENSQRDIALASFENKKNELETIYDAQKQRLVEEKLRREKDQARLDAMVKTKRIEYDRIKSLRERDLISQAEMDRVEGELEILMAERNSQVQSMESQLDRIYGRIDTRTESMRLAGVGGSSLMIPGLSFSGSSQSTEQQTIALLRGSEVAANKVLEQLNNELKTKASELESLVALQNEITPLIRDVQRSDETIDRLIARNEIFHQTARSDSEELMIIEDAKPMINSVASNAVKIFGAGFIASLGCFLVPLFLLKLKSANDRKPRTETVFGIPVLGKKPDAVLCKKNAAMADEELNRLALRVCHRFGLARGVITIAGNGENQPGGLVNVVVQQLRNTGRSVALIDAWQLPGPLDGLKFNHDVVIIAADLFGQVLQLETAASRSDAVALVAPRSELQTPAMQRTVADLNDLGTRILGVIES